MVDFEYVVFNWCKHLSNLFCIGWALFLLFVILSACTCVCFAVYFFLLSLCCETETRELALRRTKDILCCRSSRLQNREADYVAV